MKRGTQRTYFHELHIKDQRATLNSRAAVWLPLNNTLPSKNFGVHKMLTYYKFLTVVKAKGNGKHYFETTFANLFHRK